MYKQLMLIGAVSLIFSCGKSSQEPVEVKPKPEIKPETPIVTTEVKKGIVLSADGTTETYALINSKLAKVKGDVVEAPDCSHSAFGKHITQVFDNALQKYVFAFHIHVTPDNDKCNDSDRQRNEIKTYDQSPDSLIASLNETVKYTWKFKIDAGFKPSSDFTHLHQIKPIDGNSSLPIITLTARYKSSGDVLEVIHTGDVESSSLKYLASIPLKDFKGEWIEVEEDITYNTNGKYSITIKRISDNKILLKKDWLSIDMWRTGTTHCRPKWGIYRRTLQPQAIRDETVWFNDFGIKELK